MEKRLLKRNKVRIARTYRVRKKLKGTAERPRLTVSKTNKHIFAQIIDDATGVCLFGVGTRSKALRESKFQKKSKDAAAHIGKLIGQAAKDQKIDKVVFDRGRYKYHGLVATLADAAREAGLKY